MYRMQQCRTLQTMAFPLGCRCKQSSNVMYPQARQIEVKVELPGSVKRDPSSLIVLRLARLNYEGKS